MKKKSDGLAPASEPTVEWEPDERELPSEMRIRAMLKALERRDPLSEAMADEIRYALSELNYIREAREAELPPPHRKPKSSRTYYLALRALQLRGIAPEKALKEVLFAVAPDGSQKLHDAVRKRMETLLKQGVDVSELSREFSDAYSRLMAPLGQSGRK